MMMQKIRSLVFGILVISMLFTYITPVYTYAAQPQNLTAKAAVLMEEKTGKVLYAKNEQEKMYPASTTKLLTALVALDYLDPEEMVVAGSEVYAVPIDSSKAGHEKGETLKVENLIRGLIIPSGNETACVVAKAVAAKVQPETLLDYNAAEKLFCQLMNEKAKSLGCTSSNFVNPHGYHNDNHYTTAMDMALISKAAMENPLIQKIATEQAFDGNGAGENPAPNLKTRVYDWKTHNFLISNNPYAYPYATGLKTGFTDEAEACVAATATKDDVSLIAVVLYSPDPGRWVDAAALFDYGFENFAYREVQAPNTIIDTVALAETQLGQPTTLEVVAQNGFSDYLSMEELSAIEKVVAFNETFMASDEIRQKMEEEALPADATLLTAPITKGDVVGQVTYTLNGKTIFTDNLLATNDVALRTFKSDMTYYTAKVKSAVFSLAAIPFWLGGLAIIVILVAVIRRIRIRNRRRAHHYTFRKRR